MSLNNYIELIEYGKKSLDNYISVVEKQLATQYAGAYKYARSQLDALYEKYGDDMKLAEIKKYNRYDILMADLNKEYKKLTGKAINATTKTSTASVTSGYNTNWFAMEQVAGSLSFGKLPVDAIRASVYSEYSGANFIKRYGILYQSTVDKVAQSITRGIVTGQGYAKTADQVKDVFGLSYYNTLRIIRTESTRAWTEGSLASYERAAELNIDGAITWLASFDNRTREAHAELNGQQADADGLFHIDGASGEGPGLFGEAGLDINCRCSTYFSIKGADETKHWSYSEWSTAFEKWK